MAATTGSDAVPDQLLLCMLAAVYIAYFSVYFRAGWIPVPLSWINKVRNMKAAVITSWRVRVDVRLALQAWFVITTQAS